MKEIKIIRLYDMIRTVRMEEFAEEFDHGRFIGVFFRKLEGKAKRAPVPWRVFWTEYNGIPHHQVVWIGGAIHPLFNVCCHTRVCAERWNEVCENWSKSVWVGGK